MELFQNFLCNTEEERDRLSNTIELWDAVPKYIPKNAQQRLRQPNGMMQSLTKVFRYRGKDFELKMFPARIETPKGEQDTFPSEREEIIEDALRKLSVEKGQGFLDQEGAGVSFTIRQLRKLLEESGHGLPQKRIIESLKILSGTIIELTELNSNHAFYRSPIITEIGAVSRTDWEKDPKSRWYVRFSPLVAESIHNTTFRQFDFTTMISHSSSLGRWLYKRMAHLYIQASLTNPYQIRLTTIKRDSGLLNASALRFDARTMRKAFNEMIDKRVLLNVEENILCGPRRSMKDILYSIIPHPIFIRQIKAANKRMRLDRNTLTQHR